MGIKIKKLLRASFLFILTKLIPELSFLKHKNIYWPYLMSEMSDNQIDKFSKIEPPYKIFKTEIGEGTYIACNSFVSITQIGKYCSIGPNFLCGWGIHPTNGLSTSPMFYSTIKQNGRTLSMSDKIEERKKIFIGNDVYIGLNVTVLDGVKIGDGAIIGAGAVVSKDIPPYAIAIGCPIKIIKYRFSEEVIVKLLKIKWWNFSENMLQDVEKYFYEVNAFINKYSEYNGNSDIRTKKE